MNILAQLNEEQHSIFGVIGLFVFMGLFALVLVYTFSRRNKAKFERASQLPLENDRTPEAS